MQWNNRGNKYSVPKPVPGASNHRVKGGGKGGWGNELILAEDQKEYTRLVTEARRQKKQDITDPDFLPSILSGDRSRAIGRPKIGPGRTVNSRKR
jgi:RNA-binding protein NOB1